MKVLIPPSLILTLALSACGGGGGGGGSVPSTSPAPLSTPGISTPGTGTNPSVGTSPGTPAVSSSATTMQGDGSDTHPFQVTNVEQLAFVSILVKTHSSDSYHYQLTNDLTLPNVDKQGKCTASNALLSMIPDYCRSGWEPIGTESSTAYPFTGVFDGQGHEIKNLYMDRVGLAAAGLFGGASGGNTIIKNLGVQISQLGIKADSPSVGGLVGYNSSQRIENCHVIGGFISAEGALSQVGGLVGDQDSFSSIATSYVSGVRLESQADVGGLVGENDGTITQSYAASTTVKSLKGGNQGSLVGLDKNDYYPPESGTIQESYALTDDTAKLKLAGAFDGAGQVKDSYSLAKTFYYDPDDKVINPGTPDASEHQTTFRGFDFSKVWGIDEGKSTPYLIHNEQIPHPAAP